ncbi:redoxin domain-containing protein [bacterium]|nr:redoxin domain-containing protein [bacterium]
MSRYTVPLVVIAAIAAALNFGVLKVSKTVAPPPVAPPVAAPANAGESTASAVPASAEKAEAGKQEKPGEKTYKLKGIVREIDKDTGEVMVRHEEIPGFMKAMTMPFDLKGQEVLGELFVGDEIEGSLVVKPDDMLLKDVVITNPAPPAAISIGPDGKVEVKAKPVVLSPGELAPDMTVTLQDGKSAKISDYRGKTLVLTFVYTRCPVPTFCPLMDRKFGELAARLRNTPREDKVRLLSISFDPEHDTPEVLTSHAKARGAKPPLWTYSVASHEELGKFGPQLGLIYGPGEKEIMHNLCTAVIAPDGTIARLDVGKAGGEWTIDEMVATIVKTTAAKAE